MCGLCGLFALDGSRILPERLAAFRDAAAHRGPDDAGMVLFKGSEAAPYPPPTGVSPWHDGVEAGLGHRRLSIIDLSPLGHQPMRDEKGRWIVYNGEIYNHVELRAELKAAGYPFRSHSDTEVILAAYDTWGPDCLRRFNGMWAFALYDAPRQRLFLARDRFGIKPLYYRIRPGYLAFASELKQFSALEGPPPRINKALLADLLLWKFETHTDETFFEGICALPAGHFVELDRDDILVGQLNARRYWAPSPAPLLPLQEAVEEFGRLLEDAVRLRLRADVPVGVTLSGGLDSSSITCIAARLQKEKGNAGLDAFTAVFEDQGFSEKAFAEEAARHAGARHRLIACASGNLASDWTGFIRTMEEPFASLSYYANWKVYRQIRAAGLSVVLNGQGGDELLMGYDRYRAHQILFLLRRGRWGNALAELWHGRTHASFTLRRLLLYLIYFLSPSLRAARGRHRARRFLRKDFYAYGADRVEHLRRETEARDRPHFQEKEFTAYTLPHLLHHEDRVSMSHSVEARLPFLDYRLYEFIQGQADALLIWNGWSKAILREAMRDILPESIRLRTLKMGFDTPTGRLIHDNLDFFEPLLCRHAHDPYIDARAVMSASRAGRIDEHLLCAALTYLSWKETFAVP